MNKIINKVITESRKEHSHTNRKLDYYCRECGEYLGQPEVIIQHSCSNCGHLVAETDRFCGHCGNELDTSTITRYWYKNQEMDKESFDYHIRELGLEDKVK